ncbi:uncharacterized protein [Ambystoma mexicanum]|uniref:uncharacterized protein n=1 Tax=Ambystoma mexicanum TaxID=8296 RepID=UPI0037E7E836
MYCRWNDLQEEEIAPIIPALGENEKYHVFISFSSLDSPWVLDVLGKLEAVGLKVCYHGRDFVPGKLIIENMEEAIQSSQKTQMVLSPDFVRSGWCLFEANLLLLKECMERKPIVPVMLKPCPIPLHLNHLTYLEADDFHFFRKLLRVLCMSKEQMRHSTMIPYQPSALYNGKTLLTLSAVKENIPIWQMGTFSTRPVPDQLLIEHPFLYERAIQTINTSPAMRSCIQYLACRVLFYVFLVNLGTVCLYFYLLNVVVMHPQSKPQARFIAPLFSIMIAGPLVPAAIASVCFWGKRTEKQRHCKMTQRPEEANILLLESLVLISCESRKLHFVYVLLAEWRRTIEAPFSNDNQLAEEMLRRALVHFSSGYACCLAKKHFPFGEQAPAAKHLEHGICFCQYVSLQLKQGNWF